MRILGKQWRPGLLAKMMIRSAIVLSLAILLVETIAYNTSRQQIMALTEERGMNLTSLYAERVDREIEAIEASLHVIHDLPALREYFYNRQYHLDLEAENLLDGVARYLVGLHQRQPAYAFVSLTDNSGDEFLSMTRGQLVFPPVLTSLVGSEPDEISGGLPPDRIVDGGFEYSSRISAHALVFRHPLIIDEIYWGDAELHYDLSHLVSGFAREQLFESGHLAIYDDQGAVIYDPEFPAGSTLAQHRPRVADALIHLSETTSKAIEDLGGTTQMLSVTPASRKPWLIVSIVPEDEVLRGINRTRNLIVLLVLFTLAVEFAVVVLFTQALIVRPARRLLEGTRHILAGSFGHQVKVTTQDEFGDLAETFNAMSHSLEETVSEMRARGGKIETLNESLSHKVDQLQKEIAEKERAQRDLEEKEEKLRHAEKMEAVGHLAGGVAHEFNNLLAGIMGYAELLRQDLKGEVSLIEHTDSILGASKQAAELTSQLLAFSRRGSLRVEPLDLNSIIREMMKLIEHTVDRRIEIRFDFDSDKAMFRGDRVRVQSALINLALNARDAMPQGGVLAFHTTTAELDRQACLKASGALTAGSYVVLEVTDSGHGIPEEVIDHIFEPFFTTKERGKGTGIGLAAVYGTVQSHSGSIDVISTQHQGTTFRICLPSTTESASQTTPAKEVPRSGHGMVLLVDDESILRDLGHQMLQRLGYRVLSAADGKLALEMFKKHQAEIDIVLLDVMMPVMGGRDTLRVLRQIAPGLPVILCSGFSVEGDDWDSPDLGIQGILHKPFQIRELANLLSQALAESPAKSNTPPA